VAAVHGASRKAKAEPDNPPMHLMIPFAAPLSEAGRQASATLSLPHLQTLLGRWTAVDRDTDDEWSLSPPHERARARALGQQGRDGQLPWAALQAQADGVAVGDEAWGLITPTHWHLGTDQVSLLDPQALRLDEASSRACFAAVQDLFTSQGYALRYASPLHWYIAHESLAHLATASLDRVIGRNVDAWLGSAPALQAIRRLQSEVQMVLYTHPLNGEREARGLLPVNSFWLSGCGVAQAVTGAEPTIDKRLRSPALADDWAAWVKAWDTLDAGPLAELLRLAEGGEPVRLTLCGERSGASFEPVPRSLLQRARGLFAAPAVRPLLESL
jgi:hypothetical protein